MLLKNQVLKSPSNYALLEDIFFHKIFSEIKKLKPGQGGEIHITDAIKILFIKEKFFGNIFKGKYLDCGTLMVILIQVLNF